MNVERENGKKEVNLLIWDVLGQKGFEGVKKLALDGTQGALLVCDLTRKSTLENLENYWYKLIVDNIGNIPVIILANKKDLPNWEFGEDDVKKFAEKINAPYFLTSAKTGEFVNESFKMIAEMCLTTEIKLMVGDEEIRIHNLKDVVDFIMKDFSLAYGSVEDAMPIIRHQIKLVNLDIEKLRAEDIEKLINRLYLTEKDFLGMEKAKENKMKRLRVLRKLKSQQ